MVDIGILDIVQKHNGRLHLFGDLKGDLTSGARRNMLLTRVYSISDAPVIIGIGHVVFL